MDGLECSEISLNNIAETYDFRMESEFYKKEYLKIQAILNLKKTKRLNEGLCEIITDGTHYTPNYQISGVSFLSALNIQENYLDLDSGYKYISIREHKELCKRVLPKVNDVLLRKVGVGKRKACVVPNDIFEFSIFVSVALIRTKINPYFLSAYINSKYGQTQLLRFNKGIGQPDLHLEDIERLIVPIQSDEFMDKTEMCIKQGNYCLEKSRKCYANAEELLLTELSIKDFTLTEKNFSVRNLSKSFRETGRLDAEYYQPKYDELFTALCKTKTVKLGDVVNITKSIEPGSEYYVEEGIPFVRVSDMNKFGITEPQIKISKITVPSIEKLYPKEDTILFSKDGSVGIAYKAEEDCEFVTSNALLHLTVKSTDEILPDYLTLVLNSPVVKLQAERDSNGAVIQHWKPSEIEKVIIPLLDIAVQKEIAKEIRSSFILRRQSKQLLDCAVQAVETAIEQNEEKATAWLDKKVKEIEGL